MTNSTMLRLIQDSRRAAFGFVAWTAVWAFGLLWWAILLGTYNDNQAILSIMLVAVGLAASGMNGLMFIRIGRLLDDDEPPPVTFEAVQRVTPMRIEVNQGSMTRLGRFRLDREQWAKLAEVLANENWRWTRKNIGKAGVFLNLTAPGIYPQITEDFERLGIVADGWVTRQGREKLCELAGLDVVI